MKQPVFLDISYVLALLNTKDELHLVAKNLAEQDLSPLITTEVIPVCSGLFSSALELYANRMDKEWGITNCISFVVMNSHQLTEALTSDRHFEQAGFKVLLHKE